MRTTRLRQKLFLILFGLISVFLLLEVGLRLGGGIYHSYRIKDKNVQLDNGNTIRILCLGDSMTFGVGAEKGFSYPEQLEVMLNKNSGKKFIVYNGGVPGFNSSQLFRDLENNIQRYRPDIIIVMSGCNNNNALEQSNYFLFVDKYPRVYLYRLDAYLSHMRSYSLVKIALINFYNTIKSKARLKAKSFIGNKIFAKSINKQNIYKIEHIQEELREKTEKHIELGMVYESQNKFNLAIIEYKKAIELNPFDDTTYHMLGILYLHKTTEDRYELAIQALKKAVEINPLNQSARRELFDAYYRSGKIDLALEEVKIIHNLNPKDAWAGKLLTYGLPDFSDLRVFEKMLKYDFKNIITLIHSKKIKLILLSYPSDWPNDTLRQIAKINKVPFVDNEFVFKKLGLLTGYKRQNYFIEDGHCNANGYKVIAKNVNRVLKSEIKELLE